MNRLTVFSGVAALALIPCGPGSTPTLTSAAGAASRDIEPRAISGVQDLGTLGGDDSFAAQVSGTLVYGTAATRSGLLHAFVADLSIPGAPLVDIGAMVDPDLASHVDAVDGTVALGHTFDEATYEETDFAVDVATKLVYPIDFGDAVAVSGHVVVGTSAVGSHWHAFAYDLASPTTPPVDLGTLGGRNSEATGITGTTVVGSSQLGPRGVIHTFAYDLAAAQPRIIDLTPGVFATWPAEVVGQVVEGSAQRTRHRFTSHPYWVDLSVSPPVAHYYWRGDGPGTTDGRVFVRYDDSSGTLTVTPVDSGQPRNVHVRLPAHGALGLVGGSIAAGGYYHLGQRAFVVDLDASRPVAIDLPRPSGAGPVLPLYVPDEREGSYQYSWASAVGDGVVVGTAAVGGHLHATVWAMDPMPVSRLRAVRMPAHVREGHDAVVVVKRTGMTDELATVRYRAYAFRSAYPVDTTGFADQQDFRTVAGTLTFAPGQRSARIRVPVLRDRVVEPAETFYVILGDARGAALVTPFEAEVEIGPG